MRRGNADTGLVDCVYANEREPAEALTSLATCTRVRASDTARVRILPPPDGSTTDQKLSIFFFLPFTCISFTPDRLLKYWKIGFLVYIGS